MPKKTNKSKNKSKSKTKTKVKKVKRGRNKKHNVLITKIIPRAKKIHKQQGIDMTKAIKQASAEYRAGKL